VSVVDVAVESCDPFARLDEIYDVYVAAQAGVTDDARARLWRDEYLPRHATRPDFDFLIAVAAESDPRRRGQSRRRRAGRGLRDLVAGFAYGYTGSYGEWWTDRIATVMTPEARAAWLDPPHFEVVELHVHPRAQRRGIGTRLLDELLSRQPHDRALLTTHAHDRPGLPFYTGLGWRRLADIRFDSGRPLMTVMGLDGLRRSA
jgi:ribosomal protein S18 acetylase RimI-like enzyme